MVDIEFEDPPAVAVARVRTPGRYVEWAYALREYPGQWAVLPEGPEGARSVKGAENLAQGIRRGTTAGFKPKGTYDAVADEVTDDKHPEPYGKVWVKFLDPQPPKGGSGGSEGGKERPNAPARDDDPGDPSEAPEGGAEGALPVQQNQQQRRVADPSEIRQWARTNGFNVPDRGRLPTELTEAYYRAHDRPRHIAVVPSAQEG